MRLTRCPACGKGQLFEGFLRVAGGCNDCGLSYAGHEQGDGPAYISILIIGTLAGIGAAVMEVALTPPFWLHALVWIPFILVGSLLCLRLSKAALISAQYQLRKDDFSA